VLTLTNVTECNEAAFVLTATNPVGSSNSFPATLTVMPVPSFANATNGLVLHLKFDGDLLDSSGRTNNGTEKGSISFVPGVLGQALHYNTDTTNSIFNYVTLGVRDDLQFSSNVDFTVSYWVRIPSNALTGDLPFICTSQQSFGDRGYTLAPSFNGGGWSWSLNDVGVYGDAINDGRWHHLAHVFDRDRNVVTYLDGAFSGESPIFGIGDIDTGAPTNIGQSGSGHYSESAEADIDDIAIWRRALGTYEARAIYYAGKEGRGFETYGPVAVKIHRCGADLEIIWQAGTLLQSNKPNGPWTPVPGATAPHYRITPGPGAKFFRVQL
jgi:hypothetical protein